MSNTNSFSGIVKILETPRSYIFNQKARLTKVRVELPQKRKNKKNAIVCLLIWGNLGRQVQKFYTTNDYVLIEGYPSLRSKKNRNSRFKPSKRLFITVGKIYPILLSTDRSLTKISKQ
jgi:hypothetical protein